MKKCLILVSALLLSNVNMFAQMQKEVQKQVTGAVKCENYSLGSDCYCHRYMYQQKIKGKATYTAKGAPSYAMIEAKQRECMHAYNPHYSGASEYEKKLKQIPMSLIPAEEQSKGNIQAQYLFNQETEAAFRDPKVNNTEKADEFLDKNIEILIANMINKGWAAKNIMKHLYAGNLTTEQKEAALQTLNANLPNVGKCKSDICKVPGTVGDVAELFANCGEDACLLTALHVELFNSLVQSGAKSVTTDQALKLLTNMLVKNVGDANGKSKRFGDKQANATVKIPVLKAILELGDEDYYLKTTKKVLDKKTMSYSDSDTEVMSFIIDSYSAMDRYDPLIEMALNQTKNQVAKIEAAIALAGSDHPEILTDEEKQKIANILHYSYASETTACPEYYNDTRLGGSPVLAGPVNTTETDVILKQRICEAYTKLGVKGINDRLPCYPCQGNLETDGQTLVAETLLSFFLDDAIDDIMFGALTFGTGVVAKHVIKGPKYINKTRRLANKVRKAVKGGNKFTDKITAGVSVPKKARKAKKAKRYTLTKSSNGKTVAIWESPTTPNTTDVKKAATTPGTVKKGGPNVEEKINDIAARSDFGNQLQTSDVPGTNPKGTQSKSQTSSSRPVVDPNKMKEMPPTNTGRPRSAQVNKSVNTPVKPAARVEDATDVVHGAEAVEGALNRVSEPIPTLTPKKTALSPTELEPKLTGKLDDEITLAKGGTEEMTMGFKPQPKTRSGETKDLGYTSGGNSGTPTQGTPSPKDCIGFNCQPTTSGTPVPTGRIGYNHQTSVIDKYTVTDGTSGVQDLRAKGGNTGPQARGPEGPNARNPYDVRNQAGGTPDTPGTPQQDLSGLNKQISTTPPHQTTPLTKQEADDLFKQRQRQRENRPWKREEKNWELRDEELSGTVKVERSGYGEWKITKADGSTRIATREEFETWINGVPGVEGCNISQKERDAIKGLDKFSDPYETRMDKRWQDIDRKRDRRSYTDAEWTHDKEGIKREEKFHGTVKVEITGTTQSGTIPKNRTVTITKADGTTYRTNLDEFERWINDNDFPISQKEKDAIKGLDDILDAKKRTQQMDKLFSGKGQLPAQIAYRPQGIKNSLNSGCSDFKSCKQLVDYLIDSRKTVHEETSSLLSLYAKETGNNNVDDMYKSLLDFFERRGQNEGYDYLNSFLNDNSLRNFLFNNGSVSGFDKIADNMLPALKWQDLAKVLKSDTPENLKTLRQLATDDDWKYVISKSRELIGKRRAYFIEQYEDALLDIERIAPKAAEDIRHGKVPHSVTLTKAGVDKQKAQNVAYWYHSIKQIDAILK